MEEIKKDNLSTNNGTILLIINSLILNLETCTSHKHYMELLQQLRDLTKINIEIARAHSYLLSKYPNLPNVEPKTIAKLLREYYSIEPSTQRLILDIDSTQNLKKELRKTYHDNNIKFLANSTL